MCGSCWSRRGGGSVGEAPAGAVRGAGGAGPLVAAGDAGRAARAAALARMGRVERALCQRGIGGVRGGAAAVRGDRRRDPGRARRHAGGRRAGALHGAGHSLGEPEVRRGEPGLGRAPQQCRRRARKDGQEPPRPARLRRLAPAASGRAALHAQRLPGVRHRPASRPCPAPRPRPLSARSGGRWRGPWPPPAPRPGGWSRTGCCHWRRSWWRRTSRASGTERPSAPVAAGRRAIPSTSSVSRRAALSPSTLPASPSTTPTIRTSRCACSLRSPTRKCGRAGGAMR